MGGRGRQISEFQDSQGYTEKPCLEKQNKTKQNKTKQNKTKQNISKPGLHPRALFPPFKLPQQFLYQPELEIIAVKEYLIKKKHD